ncbi:MAG: hypothetical protein WC254_04060 [Candidatus Woesearchaeota archaeon]|jgi:hypothetical protein
MTLKIGKKAIILGIFAPLIAGLEGHLSAVPSAETTQSSYLITEEYVPSERSSLIHVESFGDVCGSQISCSGDDITYLNTELSTLQQEPINSSNAQSVYDTIQRIFPDTHPMLLKHEANETRTEETIKAKRAAKNLDPETISKEAFTYLTQVPFPEDLSLKCNRIPLALIPGFIFGNTAAAYVNFMGGSIYYTTSNNHTPLDNIYNILHELGHYIATPQDDSLSSYFKSYNWPGVEAPAYAFALAGTYYLSTVPGYEQIAIGLRLDLEEEVLALANQYYTHNDDRENHGKGAALFLATYQEFNEDPYQTFNYLATQKSLEDIDPQIIERMNQNASFLDFDMGVKVQIERIYAYELGWKRTTLVANCIENGAQVTFRDIKEYHVTFKDKSSKRKPTEQLEQNLRARYASQIIN